jgi:hypothetical protein
MAVQNYGAVMQGAADLTAMPANAFLQAQAQKQAMEYRNAMLAQDQQRLGMDQQQYADQQAAAAAQGAQADEDDAEWDDAFAKKDWGRMARVDPQTTKILWDQEQAQKPKAGTLYQTAEGFLPAEQAVGKMPYQAPQQYGPESLQPFTQADGSVVMVGNRGTVRPTDLKGPVKTDPAQAKTDEKRAANETAWNVYRTGMDGLTTAMDGADTGPLVGRLPAFTAAQQTADGAVAAMAPVLKQLFRSSGEGVFTDKDQEMLIAMLPTRTDRPEARAAKLANIDRIVQAKLGAGGGKPATSKSAAPKLGDVVKGYRFKGGDPSKKENWVKQ